MPARTTGWWRAGCVYGGAALGFVLTVLGLRAGWHLMTAPIAAGIDRVIGLGFVALALWVGVYALALGSQIPSALAHRQIAIAPIERSLRLSDCLLALLISLAPLLVLLHLLRRSRFAFVYGDWIATVFWSMAGLVVFLAVSLLRTAIERPTLFWRRRLGR